MGIEVTDAAKTMGDNKQTNHRRTNDDDVINRRYLSLYIKDWKKDKGYS